MLNEKIQQLRIARGWTQGELAKQLGISEKAVKNWESGISKPSIGNAIGLAQIFCISTDHLFGIDARDPIYIDFLPPNEQQRARRLMQAYTNIVMNELQSNGKNS